MHDDYYAQFYEPYSAYSAPILAIPGNHDGEVDDATKQTVDPISKGAPRVGLSLPNAYWTESRLLGALDGT